MDPENHRSKAAHNERFIQEVFGDFVVTPSPFLDWVVTAVFYVAVHKVDELLAYEGVHPSNHGERKRHVSIHTDLRPITTDYRFLEDRSRESRYGDRTFDAPQGRSWTANKLGKVKSHIDRRVEARTPRASE